MPNAATTQAPLDSPKTTPAAPLDEPLLVVELELEPELVAVPELEPDAAVDVASPVGVAEDAGKVEPAALTSKGWDVA